MSNWKLVEDSNVYYNLDKFVTIKIEKGCFPNEYEIRAYHDKLDAWYVFNTLPDIVSAYKWMKEFMEES